MITNNSGSKIELPADLKKAVDKVRSQLEVSKNELLIIQKARYSESASVEQLIRQRQFLASEIKEARSTLKDLKDEFETVGEIVEKNKKEAEELQTKLDGLIEESREIEKEKANFEQDKEDRAKEFADKKKELAEREAGIVKNEAEVEKRLDEFKKFMKQYD